MPLNGLDRAQERKKTTSTDCAPMPETDSRSLDDREKLQLDAKAKLFRSLCTLAFCAPFQ